jgi:LysM repeat protein
MSQHLVPAKSSQLESRERREPSNTVIKGKPQSTTVAARAGNISKAEIKAEAKLKDAAKRRSEKSIRQARLHVVRRGENLAVIAKKYGVSVRELATHNHLKKQSTLFVGKKLEIPKF